MARRRTLEEQLAEIAALADDPTSKASMAGLRKALGAKSNHVAGKAATIIAEHSIESFADALIEAFDHFMTDPVKRDPGCAAKQPIAEALYQIGEVRPGVFLQGIHHVQPEPVWGGSEDTAAELRATCAMGLVRAGYDEVMLELGELLGDPEVAARTGAIRAIAYSERPDGLPLLLFKAKLGDENPEVLGECFAAMLKLAPKRTLDIVARHIDSSDPAASEAAILALGGSRLAEATDVLINHYERTLDHEQRRAILLALAMLRSEEAIDFLLDTIREGTSRAALRALEALSMHRYDDGLTERVAQAVKASGDRSLAAAMERMSRGDDG